MNDGLVIELSGRVAARSRSVYARRCTVSAATEGVDAPRSSVVVPTRSLPAGSILEDTEEVSATPLRSTQSVPSRQYST